MQSTGVAGNLAVMTLDEQESVSDNSQHRCSRVAKVIDCVSVTLMWNMGNKCVTMQS
jgi:hypothetical protein